MKKYFVIIALLTSCSNNPKQQSLQTVQEFLTWYEKNYQTANSFNIVNQGDGVFYSVNFEETEKYLEYLSQSGFVSEAYLASFREYFKKADADFKNDPINEGPPPGFDFDIILYTQEPELIFENSRQPDAYVVSANKNTSTIQYLAGGFGLRFTLSRNNQHWLIDSIAPVDIN